LWEDVPQSHVEVGSTARESASHLLPNGDRPLAVLHPGATNGEAKRWPLPHWVQLADVLAQGGWRTVLVGGAGDIPLGRQIVSGAATPPLDLIGKTDFAELCAVIERADVLVSGDSGPVHIAVALDRPTVAIHGPTDPQHSGPADLSRAVVVRHELPCSPCYRLDRVADCPLGHTLCQRLVMPEQVLAAIRRLTASSGGASLTVASPA